MMLHGPPVNVVGRIWARSVHEVEWTIDDFLEGSRSCTSPYFDLHGTTWFMVAHPDGRAADDSHGHVSLFLHGVAVTAAPAGVGLSFGVRRRDGTVERGDPFAWVFEVNSNGHGSPRFLKRSELRARREELAPDSALTLTCTLRTREDWFGAGGSLDALSRDLTDLFVTKRGCDSILMVKGKPFAVHKWIVAARSSTLASLLDPRGEEKGVAEVPDCDDPATFGEFLAYLYSGRLVGPPADAMGLYRLAFRYGAEDLRLYCTLCIMLGLSAENVLEVFRMGDQFGEANLKSKARLFFVANYDRILASAHWDEFLVTHTSSANRLLKFLAERRRKTKPR